MDIQNRYLFIRNYGLRKPNTFQAVDVTTGAYVFIQKLSFGADETLRFARAINELRALPRHDNVIEITEYSHTDTHIFVVFPLIASNLRRFLYHQMRLPPGVCCFLIHQLLTAVSHLRRHGIIHRHIRPSSILIQDANVERPEYMRVILGGFQIARPTEVYEEEMEDARYSPLRNLGGRTLWYKPPEILLGLTEQPEPEPVAYSYAVAVWACGCILAEMAGGNPIFPGDGYKTELGQILSIFRVVGTPIPAEWPEVALLPGWHEYPQWEPQNMALVVPELSPEGIDLLQKMLALNPSTRLSAEECLDHPYFLQLDDDGM